jgi:hypothetical protein
LRGAGREGVRAQDQDKIRLHEMARVANDDAGDYHSLTGEDLAGIAIINRANFYSFQVWWLC